MKRKGLTSCLFTHYENDQKQDDESGLRGTDGQTGRTVSMVSHHFNGYSLLYYNAPTPLHYTALRYTACSGQCPLVNNHAV